MLVEIAICTWNRSALLAETLTSLTKLNIPKGVKWKVIIVDNRSTDNTQSVISLFKSQLPLLATTELKQGHTYARNAAVRAATGDLLLWTDDDCKVNPDWLAGYVFAAADKANDFWGSTITPEFEGQQTPDWIRDNWEICKGCFAARDLGSETVSLIPQRLPYGANFAVRTAVQKQHLFDTSLGRKKNAIVGEDELDFMRRLIEAGHQGSWVPNNPVLHFIDKSRMTPEYVHDYYVGQGQSKFSANEIGSRLALRIGGFWNRLMYRIKRPFAPSNVWLSHLVDSALAKGKLKAN